MKTWYIILINGMEFINLDKETYDKLLIRFEGLVSSHGNTGE